MHDSAAHTRSTSASAALAAAAFASASAFAFAAFESASLASLGAAVSSSMRSAQVLDSLRSAGANESGGWNRLGREKGAGGEGWSTDSVQGRTCGGKVRILLKDAGRRSRHVNDGTAIAGIKVIACIVVVHGMVFFLGRKYPGGR
eukprot:1191952-Rhodomonas_salina.3